MASNELSGRANRQRPHPLMFWRKWGVGHVQALAAVIAAIAAVIPVYFLWLNNSEDNQTLRIESPSPSGTDVTTDCHINVQGSGTVPRGKFLAIATQQSGDPRIWFEGTISWKARDQWEAK
jgi:hypothetical protein